MSSKAPPVLRHSGVGGQVMLSLKGLWPVRQPPPVLLSRPFCTGERDTLPGWGALLALLQVARKKVGKEAKAEKCPMADGSGLSRAIS